MTPERKTDSRTDVSDESVRNLFTREPTVIAPATSVREAALSMESAGADAGFVCDGAGSLVGIITHRELLAALIETGGANEASTRTASEVMLADAPRVAEDATLGRAARLMRESKSAHVAVVDADELLVGSISDLDIITYLAESNPKEAINLPPVDTQVMDTTEGG